MTVFDEMKIEQLDKRLEKVEEEVASLARIADIVNDTLTTINETIGIMKNDAIHK